MQNVKNILIKLRHNELGKSMILSMLCKPMGMFLSILYTPLLLSYLGEEKYGVWSTILSVVNWINYFDVGIGNGLRNELTKDVELKDDAGANQAVSTAYIVLSCISGSVLVIGCIAIGLLDCNDIFNTSLNVKPALGISFIFICLNFVLALSKVQLFAIHRAEKVGYMTVFTQILNLLGIKLLQIFTESNIVAVAILIGVNGLLINLVFTGFAWVKHKEFIPKPSSFRKEKVSAIGKLGIKFFLIQIAALVLYTTDNMIIIKLFGPTYVTPYYTAYTAFGVINGLFAAMMSPLWTKYTAATEKGDFKWIKSVVLKLDILLIPIGIGLVIGAVLFKPISQIWLHKNLDYGRGLIPLMAAYYFFYIWGSIYSTVMNGIGRVNLQIVLAIITAAINIPLSIYLGKYVGLQSSGVLLATVICMIISNVPVTVSVHRFLNQKIKEINLGKETR